MYPYDDDDEDVGPRSYEDIELDMDVRQSVHTFDPGPDGRCQAHLIRHGVQGAQCLSTQRSSIMHDDPEAEFRQMHDHGGGDCMCFESEDGPSYYDAMREFAQRQR